MYNAYSSMRKILINDGRVTDLVDTGNIKVGFTRKSDDFPCISIHRVGGNTVGKLGYGTSDAGSKDRTENRLFQVDILCRTSIEDLELIDDAVIKALCSGVTTGKWMSMQSNPSFYDYSYDAQRVAQTWSYGEFVQD
jgi:hypothetical protein